MTPCSGEVRGIGDQVVQRNVDGGSVGEDSAGVVTGIEGQLQVSAQQPGGELDQAVTDGFGQVDSVQCRLLVFGPRRAMVNSWLTRRLVRSTFAIRNARDSRRCSSVPASIRSCACTRNTARGVRISWAASVMKRRSRPSTS